MNALEALAQRDLVRVPVSGLSRDEMGPYLTRRLRLAGTAPHCLRPPSERRRSRRQRGYPERLTVASATPCWQRRPLGPSRSPRNSSKSLCANSSTPANPPKTRTGPPQPRCSASCSILSAAPTETLRQNGIPPRVASRNGVDSTRGNSERVDIGSLGLGTLRNSRLTVSGS